LLSFGIRCEGLFQQAKLGGGTEFIARYIDQRIKIEKQNAEDEAKEEAESGIIGYPKANDILIGRGLPYRECSANQFLYICVDAKMDRYLGTSDRFAKTCLSIEVVNTIRYAGFRLLQRKTTGWVILDGVSAREKVAVAIRGRLTKSGGLSGSKAPSSRVDESSTVDSGPTKRLRYDPNMHTR
jgi:hypothetical protein